MENGQPTAVRFEVVILDLDDHKAGDESDDERGSNLQPIVKGYSNGLQDGGGKSIKKRGAKQKICNEGRKKKKPLDKTAFS